MARKSRFLSVQLALTGLIGGRLALSDKPLRPWERIPSLEDDYRGRISAGKVRAIRDDCYARGVSAEAPLMERAGWPGITSTPRTTKVGQCMSS